eukprot:1010896-Rhodomonas_salina.2
MCLPWLYLVKQSTPPLACSETAGRPPPATALAAERPQTAHNNIDPRIALKNFFEVLLRPLPPSSQTSTP